MEEDAGAMERLENDDAVIVVDDRYNFSADNRRDDAEDGMISSTATEAELSPGLTASAVKSAIPAAIDISPDFAVCVVEFHHTTGNVVERVFPETLWPELGNSDELAFGGLPDGAHHAVEDDDWCYFCVRRRPIGAWHGVSCVRQVAASALNEELRADVALKRGHIQKALCVLSKEPRYGELRDRVRAAALAFQGDGEFDESRIVAAHDSMVERKPTEETFGLGCRRLFATLSAAATWRCVKALMLERSCIFVHERSLSAASDLALALVALVPSALNASFSALKSTASVLDDDTVKADSDCGAWYVGSLVGERCRVEPSASLAHLANLQEHAAKRRAGTLVVCGCSNPHLASRHLAPLYSFDGEKPTAIIHLGTSGAPSGNTIFSDRSPDNKGAIVSFHATKSTDVVSALFARGDADAPRRKRAVSPPPMPGKSEEEVIVDEGVDDAADGISSPSWRPTKCEREYLDAIDDACRNDDFGFADPDVFCLSAARSLVSRMIADVASTDPKDRDAVSDLADRWSGDFLFAWLTTTRSAAAWALVFAPKWSKLVGRRKELSQLLRPSLYNRFLHSSAHASQQLGRQAEQLLSSTMTAINDNISAVQQREAADQPKQRRTNHKAVAWFTSAASRSVKASVDAFEHASSARSTAVKALSDVRDAAAPSIVSLYSSLGDVASAAAAFASRTTANARASTHKPHTSSSHDPPESNADPQGSEEPHTSSSHDPPESNADPQASEEPHTEVAADLSHEPQAGDTMYVPNLPARNDAIQDLGPKQQNSDEVAI